MQKNTIQNVILNEYTSLDFEMGYIDGFEDIMAMETGFLQYTMALLEKEYKKELDMLGVTLPDVSKIPAVRFDKAKELVAEKYNRRIRNPYDLEPEEELLIGRYFKEEYGSDFVFVTHTTSQFYLLIGYFSVFCTHRCSGRLIRIV